MVSSLFCHQTHNQAVVSHAQSVVLASHIHNTYSTIQPAPQQHQGCNLSFCSHHTSQLINKIRGNTCQDKHNDKPLCRPSKVFFLCACKLVWVSICKPTCYHLSAVKRRDFFVCFFCVVCWCVHDSTLVVIVCVLNRAFFQFLSDNVNHSIANRCSV